MKSDEDEELVLVGPNPPLPPPPLRDGEFGFDEESSNKSMSEVFMVARNIGIGKLRI